MNEPLRRPRWQPTTARHTGHRAHATRLALLCGLLASTALFGTACASPPEAGPEGAAVVEEAADNAIAEDAGQPAQVDSSEAATEEGTSAEADAAGAEAGAADEAAASPTQPLDPDAADNAAYNEAVRAEIEDTVSTLFSGAVGETDPAWQDVIVRRMTTAELARLRQQPAPPPDAYRVAQGSVWVVGFRTDHAVTPANLLVDNDFELQDIPLEDYADADGRTSVYYILSVTERGSRLQYTPLARGILPATGALWTLEELAAIESD